MICSSKLSSSNGPNKKQSLLSLIRLQNHLFVLTLSSDLTPKYHLLTPKVFEPLISSKSSHQHCILIHLCECVEQIFSYGCGLAYGGADSQKVKDAKKGNRQQKIKKWLVPLVTIAT
ncbi:hypothetical protein CsSME_00021629 [Camellia sinensis var. sinensis]